jgi:hypothetical protein
MEISFQRDNGRVKVKKTERAELPSAEEIEENYCHKRHPNALVDAERAAPETVAHTRSPEVK